MSTNLELKVTRPASYQWQPTNFEDAMKFSTMLSKSNLVPTALKGKPEEIFLTIQRGQEVGLSPFVSLENIAVINGRTTMWGDAMLALCQSHPSFEWITEELVGTTKEDRGYKCTVKRKGRDPHVVIFTWEDAKTAGLANKPGPWTQYPKRMIQMRARGFALRDVFSDVLRGIITVEEAKDYPIVGEGTTDDSSYKDNIINQSMKYEDVIDDEITIDEDTGEFLED